MSSEMPTFIWFGSLATVPPSLVLARCQRLGVCAIAELRSGTQRARVVLRGGEVVSLEGPEPRTIDAWTDGSFRVTQGLPDFDGVVGGDRELKGSLARPGLSAILAWAEAYRL